MRVARGGQGLQLVPHQRLAVGVAGPHDALDAGRRHGHAYGLGHVAHNLRPEGVGGLVAVRYHIGAGQEVGRRRPVHRHGPVGLRGRHQHGHPAHAAAAAARAADVQAAVGVTVEAQERRRVLSSQQRRRPLPAPERRKGGQAPRIPVLGEETVDYYNTDIRILHQRTI